MKKHPPSRITWTETANGCTNLRAQWLPMNVFKEAGGYVAICSNLDLAQQGETSAEAQEALREAIKLFLQELMRHRTLASGLEELGWQKVASPIPNPERVTLCAPSPIKSQELTVTVPA